MIAEQLSLRWPVLTAVGAADYLVGASNKIAADYIARWPAWPQPQLLLCGQVGSGKSHLARIFAGRSGAVFHQTRNPLPAPDSLTQGIVLDDADKCSDATALLHLLNWLREQQQPCLLTATIPPAAWSITLPDLRSRLLALPVLTLDMPDESLVRAVLVKLFADYQLTVNVEVIDYIALRAPRDLTWLATTVATLDRLALQQQRAVTIPLARQVLGAA